MNIFILNKKKERYIKFSLKLRIFHLKIAKECIVIYIQQCFLVKAILQVLIYKALFDKSYLGSKTTMTSGE